MLPTVLQQLDSLSVINEEGKEDISLDEMYNHKTTSLVPVKVKEFKPKAGIHAE
jgi:hypothetical protein